MAAPNLLSSTTVNGKTAVASLTNSALQSILSVTTSTLVKMNDIQVTNYSSSSITCNVVLNRSSTVYYLAGTMSVPANSALVVIAKDSTVYFEEGDILQANVSTNGAASLTASYELIS